MNIDKISDEIMQDKFEECFEKEVAAYNDISEFEASIKRSIKDKDILMELTITGTAGSPTFDDFKDGKVDRAERITVIDERGKINYILLPEKSYILNATDYVVVYKLEV